VELIRTLVAILIPGIESVRRRVCEVHQRDSDFLISTVQGRLCGYIPRVVEQVRTQELGRMERELSAIVVSLLESGEDLEDFKTSFIHASKRISRDVLGEECHSQLKAHNTFVARVCEEIAQELGMSEDERIVFRRGGYLHDIGKVYSLGAYEFGVGYSREVNMALIRTHASLGSSLLHSMFPAFEREEIFAREHQERLSGNGYPSGIDAGQISVEGKAAHLADMLDIYVNRYDPARTIDEAVEVLASEFRESGLEDDPVLQAFQRVGRHELS
jgi:putative nucleotidyltransferase with HDIG domain